MNQWGPYEIQWQQRQSPAPAKEQLPATTLLGDCWAGALWRKPRSYWWAAERATSHMGYISRGGAGQSRKGFIPLYTAFIRPHAEHCRTLGPQHNKETSPGESNKAGRDSSSKEALHSQALSAWRRHGFGGASQDLQGHTEELGSSHWRRVG